MLPGMNDTANPYAAPVHSAGAEADQAGAKDWVYLGFWQRVVASLADNVLMAIAGFIIGLLCSFVISSKNAADLTSTILGWVAGIAFVLGFWFVRNATPGKMIYGAEIRDGRTFGKPSAGQYIRRYLGYLPSTLALGLGFLWVAFDQRKRGWHDMMAGTVVVRRGDSSGRRRARPIRRPPAAVRPGDRPAEDLPLAGGDRSQA